MACKYIIRKLKISVLAIVLEVEVISGSYIEQVVPISAKIASF